MPRAPSPWRYCANPLRFFPSGAPCFSPQLLLLMYFIPSGFVPSGTPCSLVQVLGAHTHARRCYHLCSGSQAENLHVHILAPCSPCSGILCSPLLSNSILTLLRYPMLTWASRVHYAHPVFTLLRYPMLTLLRMEYLSRVSSGTPFSPSSGTLCSPCSGNLCSPLRRLYLYRAQEKLMGIQNVPGTNKFATARYGRPWSKRYCFALQVAPVPLRITADILSRWITKRFIFQIVYYWSIIFNTI